VTTPDAWSAAADAVNPGGIPWRWLVFGLVAQVLFTARFLVQWIVSERARRSVVPALFWWLSLGGGGLLLIYALGREDPVFVLGQIAGIVVYARNLVLIRRGRAGAADDQSSGGFA
jgi:lipid-A-disaccharide synthase-like uncharacterized protein